MTDNEIIQKLRNNNYKKAVDGMYRVLPFIKKYVCANSGTKDDAQDIFQDALVILYKNVQAESFTLTVPLRTYLYAISKNLWMHELRRRKKWLAGPGPEDIPDIVAAEQDEFYFAKAAFNLLGEKCRQLLILFYLKKKSFREIAGALAFSDEKVAKNQKYRCLQKAKEHYLTLSTNSHEE